MQLAGSSFVAGHRSPLTGTRFAAHNAATGEALAPEYSSATDAELDAAAAAAGEAFKTFSKYSSQERAALLRTIASGLEAISSELVARAILETALPEGRLTGEVGRTCGQLRLFASVIEEGSWLNARIDTALPERKPLPRPDLRSMLFPIGPIAVFGASNFPLAFSVAGGDTASALAAGNPVIVKAHAAHPGTSELVAAVITQAVAECKMHPGVFSMLYDADIRIAQALVQHPAIEGVAFTGSKRAGRALMDLAAGRERPIPCFTEMSSVNPVFVLPGTLSSDPVSAARGLHASFTLGAGQFCTKPGLVFLPNSDGAKSFSNELSALTQTSQPFTMLTSGIADAYHKGLAARGSLNIQSFASSDATSPHAHAVLFHADVETLRANPLLQEEIFGPSTLLVEWKDRASLLAAAELLEGHLTATLLGSEADLQNNQDLIAILERKVGRLLFNGFPTGVEVSHAMVHGGPYPATSDSRFTSVGSQAILRFVRPRCYQNFPEASLPEALQNANPLGISRLINGTLSRESIS